MCLSGPTLIDTLPVPHQPGVQPQYFLMKLTWTHLNHKCISESCVQQLTGQLTHHYSVLCCVLLMREYNPVLTKLRPLQHPRSLLYTPHLWTNHICSLSMKPVSNSATLSICGFSLLSQLNPIPAAPQRMLIGTPNGWKLFRCEVFKMDKNMLKIWLPYTHSLVMGTTVFVTTGDLSRVYTGFALR